MNGSDSGWNGLMGLPQWARVMLLLGIPTAFSLILLAAFLGIVPSPLSALPEIRFMLTNHERFSLESDRAQARLLRQICRNTAKSEIGVEACNQ
jgi:hypothetical protein